MGNIVNHGDNILYLKNKDKNLFRKKIHNILFDIKDNVNGREIYLNRRKVFCRKTEYPQRHLSNMNMNDNEYLTIKLPGVINQFDDFTYGAKSKYNAKSKIQSFNILLNLKENILNKNELEISEKSSGIKIKIDSIETTPVDYNDGNTIQKNLYNINTCDEDIQDICAKQIYKNKCVIFKNNKWVWDSDNSKCFQVDDIKKYKKKIDNIKVDNIIFTEVELYNFIFLFKFIIFKMEENDPLNPVILTEDENILYILGTLFVEYLVFYYKDVLEEDNWKLGGKYNNYIKKLGLDTSINNKIIDIIKSTEDTNDKYFNILKLIYFYYLVNIEGVYNNISFTSKNFYAGEELCNCLNSLYGENLNSPPDTKCKLVDENGRSYSNVSQLLSIINNPNEPEWRKKEAKECIQYEDEENYSNVINNNMYKEYYDFPPSNITSSKSKYSIKLSGNEELIKNGLNTYSQDKRCETSILSSSEKKTYAYYKNRIERTAVTCVNQINFNNIAAENIYIGNILQNNTCGNIGTVKQYFINTRNTDGTMHSKCPSGFNSGLLLSGFNLSYINNSLFYDIFSNINGFYLSSSDYTDKPEEFLSVYENVNNPKLILVTRKVSDTTIEFKIYHVDTTKAILILTSRIFKFNNRSNEENDNEEMCIDKNLRKIYLFSKKLNEYKPEERTVKIVEFLTSNDEYPENKNFLQNYITSILNTPSSSLIEQFNTIINIIPDYKWYNNLDIKNSSNIQINGIISHNGSGLYQKGSNLFDETTIMLKDEVFLLKINNELLHGKINLDNNNISPFIIFDKIDNELVNYINNSEFYESRPIGGLLSDELISRSGIEAEKIKILNISKLIDYVTRNNKLLLIYLPSIYRYILLEGKKIINVTNIVYNLTNLDQAHFIDNLNIISELFLENYLLTKEVNTNIKIQSSTVFNKEYEINDLKDINLIELSFNKDGTTSKLFLNKINDYYYLSEDNKYKLKVNGEYRWEFYIDDILEYKSLSTVKSLNIIKNINDRTNYLIEQFVDEPIFRIRAIQNVFLLIKYNKDYTSANVNSIVTILNNNDDFEVKNSRYSNDDLWLDINIYVENSIKINLYKLIDFFIDNGLININNASQSNIISIKNVENMNSNIIYNGNILSYINKYNEFILSDYKFYTFEINKVISTTVIQTQINPLFISNSFTFLKFRNIVHETELSKFRFYSNIQNIRIFNNDVLVKLIKNISDIIQTNDFNIKIKDNNDAIEYSNENISDTINSYNIIPFREEIEITRSKYNDLIIFIDNKIREINILFPDEEHNLRLKNNLTTSLNNIIVYNKEINDIIKNELNNNGNNYELIPQETKYTVMYTFREYIKSTEKKITDEMNNFEDEYYKNILIKKIMINDNHNLKCNTLRCTNDIMNYLLSKHKINCIDNKTCHEQYITKITKKPNNNKYFIIISIILVLVITILLILYLRK